MKRNIYLSLFCSNANVKLSLGICLLAINSPSLASESFILSSPSPKAVSLFPGFSPSHTNPSPFALSPLP